MKILATALSLADGVAFSLTLLVALVLVLFYALRKKGDVKAQLSTPLLTLTLEAKDRIQGLRGPEKRPMNRQIDAARHFS